MQSTLITMIFLRSFPILYSLDLSFHLVINSLTFPHFASFFFPQSVSFKFFVFQAPDMTDSSMDLIYLSGSISSFYIDFTARREQVIAVCLSMGLWLHLRIPQSLSWTGFLLILCPGCHGSSSGQFSVCLFFVFY